MARAASSRVADVRCDLFVHVGRICIDGRRAIRCACPGAVNIILERPAVSVLLFHLLFDPGNYKWKVVSFVSDEQEHENRPGAFRARYNSPDP